MKYYFLLMLITLGFNTAHSKVFLIASDKANFESYSNTCKANNYYCMPQDFDKIHQLEKPLFAKLTDEFNLDNESYNLSFSAKASAAIAQEMLTLDELELIIFMSEKMSQQSKFKIHSHNTNYLKALYANLQKLVSENSLKDTDLKEKIIYIAGHKLVYNDKVLNFIKKNLKSVFAQIVSFDSVEIMQTYQKQFFLQGDCAQYTFWHSDLNNFDVTFMPYFDKGCSFGENIDRKSASITHHFQEHKNKYLWGLAIIAGGILLNSKPIVIEY